jgi:NADPH:quinone reductase-like Zn-dependent oxidoreductase
MKRVIYKKYGSPDVLQLQEVEKPIPGDNELLIKIHATTVTAVDSIFRRGNSLFARFATGLTRPKIKTLGTEFAGEIEATGKDVDLFKPGEHIFGDSGTNYGAHAEYLTLPENEPIAIKPGNLTFEEATGIPYGALTALPFLRDSGNIQSGQKVLINGASGAVGHYAVQLGKYYGAEVTGVCSASSAQLVRSLGADVVIDYHETDFTKSGETYDIIFDTIGKSTFSQCKGSLNPDGIYLTTVIGIPILMQIFWTSMIGTKKAKLALTGLRPAVDKKKDLHFIKKLIEAGKIRPVIDRHYTLRQIAAAHKYVENGHKKGNVVITLNSANLKN